MRKIVIIFISFILIIGSTAHLSYSCCISIRGNVNNDPLDIIDISDLVYLVDFMFNGGKTPVCIEEADVNGKDSGIDIADLVYLVDYIFKSGTRPVDCLQQPLTYLFEFLDDSQGWSAGFSDYPFGQEIQYELDFQWASLPIPLDTTHKSLFITGRNYSDDLFMFIKKPITGLLPSKTYDITFDIEFASIYPTNLVGVGGAPGEEVTMKVGATIIEPDTIDGTALLGYPGWIMNIDKGNQAVGGQDMYTVGHVGVSDTTIAYTLINNNNLTHPFTVTTDANGILWLIIGTDSGFESTTAIYYNRIEIIFY